MTDIWRYVLPCDHHSFRVRPNNPPERRYECIYCSRDVSGSVYFAEGELIDKKETDDSSHAPNVQ